MIVASSSHAALHYDLFFSVLFDLEQLLHGLRISRYGSEWNIQVHIRSI